MNAYIVTVIVIGLYLAAVLLVFVTGRLITRTKLYRRWAEKRGMQYPRSRIIEDLQPVQETMREFINASTPSRELLQRLAGTDEPIRVRKLLASLPASESSWTALSLIAVAGLVSFGREGVALTEAGGEILARMSGDATKVDHDVLDREAHVADKRLSFTHGKNGSDTVSHLQLVKEALEKNEGARLSGPVRPVRGFELGQLRTNSASLPGNNSPPTPKVQNTSPAILTSADYRELSSAIVAARKLAAREGETQALQKRLAHGLISLPGELPPDVITMYSRAELLDLDTNERLNLMLVFPIDANFQEGRISVFHPLGAAMLGRRVGDRFDWTVPYGVRRLELKAILFQPEAALAEAA